MGMENLPSLEMFRVSASNFCFPSYLREHADLFLVAHTAYTNIRSKSVWNNTDFSYL